MRLHELFEAPFTQPGLTYIVNDPKNQTQDQPALNVGRSIGTASAPPTTITSQNNAGQIPSSAQPTINTAQNGSNTANAVSIAAASQQLSKGSPIMLPMGPAKQPTNMKVTNVSNNSVGSNQKMVTVSDPNNPNAPQQTYKADDLANMIANKGKV